MATKTVLIMRIMNDFIEKEYSKIHLWDAKFSSTEVNLQVSFPTVKLVQITSYKADN